MVGCGFLEKTVLHKIALPQKNSVTVPMFYMDKDDKFEKLAGRLPENSRNSFVDPQSPKNSKRDRPKKFAFSLKADMLYFDLKSV